MALNPGKRYRRGRTQNPKDVRLRSYPAIIFMWPPYVVGLICIVLHQADVNTHTLGWMWMISGFPTLCALAGDVNRNKGFFWSVTIGLTVTVLLLVGASFGWLSSIESPSYSSGTVKWFCIFLTFCYPLMHFLVTINGRWEINSNQFEHKTWGEKVDSIAHNGKTVRMEIPDIFEFMICLSGDIVIASADGKTELKRIENIPFIHWKWPKVEQLLETVRVDTEAPDPAETDE